MPISEEKFKAALADKHIPVLILDNKWHKLFKRSGTTPQIEELEKELTALLKRQGKLNSEMKSIKKLKSELMQNIVSSMDGADEKAEKKVSESKRLINESNEKMEAYEDELLELPREIDRVNRELMIQSMALCYDQLSENTDEIEKIADWIHQIRIELKKNIIKKQEKEFLNAELYTYMHDIFGPDVMEIFDMRYEPTLKKPEKKEEETTEKKGEA
ncbi:MAG: hypothetical protein K6G27_00265 [Lachnospiraceae bacterium]|jgi:DNA repair exonuclease SbcCD ATPase subunit|nr:hypothetical protein [Lachnospiraceae bacterium]